MENKTIKLLEAISVLEKLANGLNPIDNTPLDSNHFLNDPRVIRPLFYLLNFINDNENITNRNTKRKAKKSFVITDEQIANIILPIGKIGINEFCSIVNQKIDVNVSKKLSGRIIHDKLKKLGILSEVINEEGSKRTVTNENSINYGIKMVERSFNGRPYKQIVYNDLGKEFLVNNLRSLLE